MFNRLKNIVSGITPAPIVDEQNYPEYDVVYRKPNDPRHIFRIKQKSPTGYRKKLKYDVPVAGVTHYAGTVNDFISGKDRVLSIEIEPNNHVQANALRINGAWLDDSGTSHSGQLGYIPAEIRAELVKELNQDPPNIAVNLRAMFKKTRGKSPGLRIDIWGKAANAKK